MEISIYFQQLKKIGKEKMTQDQENSVLALLELRSDCSLAFMQSYHFLWQFLQKLDFILSNPSSG